MPKALAQYLREAGAEFYDWYETTLPPGTVLTEDQTYVRLVTSFVTQDSQREEFCGLISRYLSGHI